MALMNIGFAMAAGRSPYAMQNIANALSGGADMFIADKAKKDQFNRQVQLSALQYGLGEIGKEKAQQRADERNFTTYVVGKGGITLPDGRKVEEGQDITLSMQDALKLGPQLSNLSLLDAFTKRQASMTKLLAAELKVLEAKKDKGIDLKEFRKDATEYKESIKAAKDAEVAKALIGDALLTVSEKDLTSLSATGKELIRKGATLFGIPVSKEFKTKPLFKRQLNIALNKIIPLALGKTQSANSISDRDVGFIIKAFLAEGIINQNEETGVITIDSSFLGADEDSIAKGLQSALQLIEDEQRDDFRKMSSIERNFGDVMIKGPDVTGSKFLELEIAERKGLTGGTERKYVLEDGVYRRRTN